LASRLIRAGVPRSSCAVYTIYNFGFVRARALPTLEQLGRARCGTTASRDEAHMGTALKVATVSLLLLLAWQGAGHSAFDARGVARAPTSELLVFEHPDCTYCRIFRSEVVPYYRQLMPGKAPPLRFIDLTSAASGEFALKGRIEAVPTAVLMKDGQEVGRIVGYWGREAFFRLLARMLARME
jgi:hypothetical protein